MTVVVRAPIFRSLLGWGLVLLGTGRLVVADSPGPERQRQGEPGSVRGTEGVVIEGFETPRDQEPELPAIDVLGGVRARKLSVTAEGTGDGRMILSVTNRTAQKLRVVLPPGLVASGVSGQFGGMGGGGGRGGRGGRGGGGGGGMGGGGMGGGGMGGGRGMGGGGMGMGGGGMSMQGTMPASMGMMMLGRLIMTLVGDSDSWDQTTLMSGMMGGAGMGGMGQGGMGMGGMGMGMGGRGGGFRSVPPGRPTETTLKAKETRRLPTVAISLEGPHDGEQVNVPANGEKLRLGDVGELAYGSRTEAALKRLATDKAPESIAQLVLWNVTAGLDWSKVSRLSGSWANSAELALARQFVARLDGDREALGTPDSGHLYWDEGARDSDSDAVAAALGTLLRDHLVLGLKPEHGVPTSPPGPALACRFTIGVGKVSVALATSDQKGRSWTSLGTLSIPIESVAEGQAAVESTAAEIVDSTAAGLLTKIARVAFVKGPRVKGKETYSIRIDNGSPLIINGLAIAGAESPKPISFAALGGISLSPLTSLKLPVSPEMVDKLGLKQRVRVVAADLGGL